MKLNDGNAFVMLGCAYREGGMGLTKDMNKALELFNQAAELKSIDAYFNLSQAYAAGIGVEENMDKAFYFWKQAAIKGHEIARYALGWAEGSMGNMDTAMKHYIISARCGFADSLTEVGKGYKAGRVSKDEYACTLRSYQRTIDEMKSDQRTKAALDNAASFHNRDLARKGR